MILGFCTSGPYCGASLYSNGDVIAATQSRGASAGNLNRNLAGIAAWINVTSQLGRGTCFGVFLPKESDS